MNYRVKIADRVFEVQITDLSTRPVIAKVDGFAIEVWPEDLRSAVPASAAAAQPGGAPAALPGSGKTGAQPPARGQTAPANGHSLPKVVRAPIPGVIVSIAVQPGVEVATGQELCVLEAMKMKNTIRSTRAGKIASVNMQVGQHVKHHDVLMEYSD